MKANKFRIARVAAAILVGASLGGSHLLGTARAQVGFSAGVQINSPAYFYTPLASYGSWMDIRPYGRCWRPANVAPDWRPYEIGHWEWTDVGWYWASDEPWAWACYHYGGWEFDPAYGWVWVPGTEWAPAWVTWREAPDYIGWAPCGPGGVVLSDSNFMFVDVHHFHDRLGPREVVFNDSRIFRRSRPVGGFRRESRDFDGFRRQIAVNRGPAIDPIQRATGTRFTRRPVNELVRRAPIPETGRAETARKDGNWQRGSERAPVTAQQRMAPSDRTRQPLYQEAPAAQPAPTGRNESRLYREAPSAQRNRQPATEAPRRQVLPEASPNVPQAVPHAPVETPRRQPLPEASTPTPRDHPLPAPGFERGHIEGEGRRPEQNVPRAVPAPQPRQPLPMPQAPGRERERDRSGD